MSADIINVLLTLRNQVKIYHWQTHAYARHVATDGLTATLDTLIDQFVEVYMGKYGRPKFTAKTGHIQVGNFTEKHGMDVIEDGVDWMQTKLVRKLDPRKDSELLNIKDEIVAELNKIRYLFTLR